MVNMGISRGFKLRIEAPVVLQSVNLYHKAYEKEQTYCIRQFGTLRLM